MGTNTMEEHYVTEFLLDKERIVALLLKFPLHSALTLASQALVPSTFYLAGNVFPSNLMAAYQRFDAAVRKALWTCLELDDVAVCPHATTVAETIISLPGQGGLGVQRLEEIALMGPIAKILSIAREGHPALDFFLQQFGPRIEIFVERL